MSLSPDNHECDYKKLYIEERKRHERFVLLVAKTIREMIHKRRFESVLHRVTDELCSMSPEQLQAELDKHKDGDIANIVKWSGMLEANDPNALHPYEKYDENGNEIIK